MLDVKEAAQKASDYFAGLYYSTTGSADHNRSQAGGIHEATLALGMAGGSFFGGLSDEWAGERAPYFLAAGVIAILAVAQLLLYRKFVSSARRNRSPLPPLT